MIIPTYFQILNKPEADRDALEWFILHYEPGGMDNKLAWRARLQAAVDCIVTAPRIPLHPNRGMPPYLATGVIGQCSHGNLLTLFCAQCAEDVRK